MHRIIIPCLEKDAEQISERLFDLGADSVSEVATGQGQLDLLVLCENQQPIREQFAATITGQQIVTDAEWKDRWAEHIKGFAVNGSIYLHPVTSPDPVPDGFEYPLMIDPRGAFGFDHPTTIICLEILHAAIREIPEPARTRLLDIGTGSGILAILAARMGIPRIQAFDIDPDAISMTRRNLQLNGCDLGLSCCDIAGFKTEQQYDLITANLLPSIIRDNLKTMAGLLNPGGQMILSGIIDLWDQETRESLTKEGLSLLRHIKRDGWNGYLVSRQIKHQD